VLSCVCDHLWVVSASREGALPILRDSIVAQCDVIIIIYFNIIRHFRYYHSSFILIRFDNVVLHTDMGLLTYFCTDNRVEWLCCSAVHSLLTPCAGEGRAASQTPMPRA
jgi:hypothetical protein